jgi:hypothetical protein
VNRKPYPEPLTSRVAAPSEEKILHLRRTYHIGPQRISWYLARHHGMKVPQGGMRGVLLRHSLNRLPKDAKKRTVQTAR